MRQLISVERMKERNNTIAKALEQLMTEGVHYGTIPGSNKLTLFKPGAEVFAYMAGVSATYQVETIDLDIGTDVTHREYRVITTMYADEERKVVGQGVGSCSTLEPNYRYSGNQFEVTGERIPDDWKKNKAKYKKAGLTAKQVDGQWEWVKLLSGRQERADIAETFNTVLKMARKRSYIDGVITALALSDVFVQEYDADMDEAEPQPEGEKSSTEAPATHEQKPQPPRTRKEIVGDIVEAYKDTMFLGRERKELRDRLRAITDNAALEQLYYSTRVQLMQRRLLALARNHFPEKIEDIQKMAQSQSLDALEATYDSLQKSLEAPQEEKHPQEEKQPEENVGQDTKPVESEPTEASDELF